MRARLALIVALAPVVGCSDDPVVLETGTCLRGTLDVTIVACNDPDAEYRLETEAEVADGSPVACSEGLELVVIARSSGDAAGDPTEEAWCATPL